MKLRSLSLLLCVLIIITAFISSCGNSENTSSVEISSEMSYSEVSEEQSQITETSSTSYSEASTEVSEAESEEESEEEVSYERGTSAFDEMEYTRPDYDALTAMIEEGKTKLAEGKITEDEMYDFFDELTEKLAEGLSEADLLSVKQSINTKDDEATEEYEYATEKNTEMRKIFFAFANDLLDSKYAAKVFEDYTEEEKQQIRDAASQIDDEYVELQARLTELENMYIDNTSLKAVVNGEELTLEEIKSKYGDSYYYQALNVASGDIYLEIISIRTKMAKKAGYDNYRDYAFEKIYSRDYTSEQVSEFREYVKKYLVPLFNKYYSKVSSYYYKVGDYNNAIIHADDIKEYLEEINPEMLEAYNYMNKFGLYIYGDEDQKQEGAYTTFLYNYDEPLIFQKFSGGYDNIQTFIHEFGHFFNYYIHGEDATEILDIAEIHSQANELLFLPTYEKIFNEKACKNITRYQLFINLYSIIQTCIFDEFEEKAFSGNYTTTEELNAMFESLVRDYSMRGLSSYTWSMVHHFYLYPMYYISYGTSAVPALQIYEISLEDREKAIEIYNKIQELSCGEVKFSQLLEEAGLENSFSESTVSKIADMITGIFPKS